MPTEINFEKYPALLELVDQAKVVKRDGFRVASLSAQASRFALSGEATGVLTDAIRIFLTAPMANPSLMQQDNVVLHNEPAGVLIAIGRSTFSDSSPVYSAPSDTLLAPLTKHDLEYSRYELTGEFNPEIFSRDVFVQLESTQACKLGDVVLFESGKINEYASSGTCVLKVYDRRSSVGLMWEFDRSSGQATGAYASDVESTTLRYLLKFLATYPDHADPHSIALLLSHPYHFVRWEALKTLAVVSPSSARSALPSLVSDPHPHIQAAAAKVMSQELGT